MALIQETPTSLPRSNAKRAWGLLQDVKAAILQEPRRIHMPWAILPAHLIYGGVYGEASGPACGTVGCFAGWVQILADKADLRRRSDIISGAIATLGASCNFRLAGEKYGVFNAGTGDSCEQTSPGTPAHAKAVVRRIDRFMRKNERRLRNQKV